MYSITPAILNKVPWMGQVPESPIMKRKWAKPSPLAFSHLQKQVAVHPLGRKYIPSCFNETLTYKISHLKSANMYDPRKCMEVKEK
jgi:hypothetical protein